MSYNYTDHSSSPPDAEFPYWLAQPHSFHSAVQPWQQTYHPWQPLPYQPDGHQQHHPYHARQPTSWDPPWMRQTATYQQPPSYEPDMYSPPPPGRRPTCWDPPAYWETPGQRPFHEVSAYDQPLPPNHNSGWNQPAPQPPRPATTAPNSIEAMLDQLLEAFKRMESRFDEIDHRIDNDAVYGSLESMNEFIPDEVVVTCPLNFDMVMLEDNKANDGGDQPMDSGDHPMESGGDAPQVPVEEKRTDALLDVDIIVKPIYTMLEVMERVDEDSLVFHANGSHLGTMLPLSRWLSMEPNEEYYWTKQSGIFDPGRNISQSSDHDWKKPESFIGTKIIIQIRCHVIVDYGRTKQQSFAVDPGEEVSPKLVFTMLFILSWFPP